MVGEISGGGQITIFVTGSQGLVGSNLIKKLSGITHDVHETSFDLRNKQLTKHTIDRLKPEVVYHCAAQAAESRGQISPIDMTENNLNIFLNVLVPAINNGVKKFIYTSSVAVYGEATIPYKEDGETIPKDVYGVNKLACEQILKIMAKIYGFEYVIFRPHNIYGPGMNMANPAKNVVGLFMRKMIEQEALTLYGGGEMRRAFSYVDDVVEVLVDALKDKFNGLTMNVGSDQDISIKELLKLMEEMTGIKAIIDLKPARPQEISMFLADHTLQKEVTSYKDTDIREGLTRTWEWVKKKELGPYEKQENEILI